MPITNAIIEDLFRTKWAACNLHMQLIRCIENCQLQDNDVMHVAFANSVEDRVEELGTELEKLRRNPAWPEDDERLSEK